MYTCVDCVSRVSVSSVLLAVEILRKNDKTSQVKCRQRPFRSVLVFFGSVGKNRVLGRPSWELAPYDCSLKHCYEDFAAWCKLVSGRIKVGP